jgi:DNA-directed RNA polymerase specialized sigma24 family protein
MQSASSQDLQDAFRELHGSRLHGFALLLTLGDRPRAARLAGEALAEGVARVPELRHPERAAAWLRGRVLRRARRDGEGARRRRADVQLALAELGAGDADRRGLERLSLVERAAVIATAVERLDRRDVATLIGREGRGLDRLVRRAMRTYLATASIASTEAGGGSGSVVPGPITERVHRAAERALR